jgi:hypothetical protein
MSRPPAAAGILTLIAMTACLAGCSGSAAQTHPTPSGTRAASTASPHAVIVPVALTDNAGFTRALLAHFGLIVLNRIR